MLGRAIRGLKQQLFRAQLDSQDEKLKHAAIHFYQRSNGIKP